MSLSEAYVLALKVLKQVMEEKVDETNVQLAQVRACGWHRFPTNCRFSHLTLSPPGHPRRNDCKVRDLIGSGAQGDHRGHGITFATFSRTVQLMTFLNLLCDDW
jgi:hypothetical protein